MNYRETLAAKLHEATNKDGGATLHRSGAPLDQDYGYVVGGRVGLSVVLPVDAVAERYRKAVQALEAVELSGLPLPLFGTWVHEQQVYVDAVSLHDDYTEAVTVARIRGELAIYDLAERVEIPV